MLIRYQFSSRSVQRCARMSRKRARAHFIASGRVYEQRIFARIFLNIWLVRNKYLMSMSFKFHKDFAPGVGLPYRGGAKRGKSIKENNDEKLIVSYERPTAEGYRLQLRCVYQVPLHITLGQCSVIPLYWTVSVQEKGRTFSANFLLITSNNCKTSRTEQGHTRVPSISFQFDLTFLAI